MHAAEWACVCVYNRLTHITCLFARCVHVPLLKPKTLRFGARFVSGDVLVTGADIKDARAIRQTLHFTHTRQRCGPRYGQRWRAGVKCVRLAAEPFDGLRLVSFVLCVCVRQGVRD